MCSVPFALPRRWSRQSCGFAPSPPIECSCPACCFCSAPILLLALRSLSDFAACPPGVPSSGAMAVQGCWALRRKTGCDQWSCPNCGANPVRCLATQASGWLCAACFRDKVGRAWCCHQACDVEAEDAIGKRPRGVQSPPQTRRDDPPSSSTAPADRDS